MRESDRLPNQVDQAVSCPFVTDDTKTCPKEFAEMTKARQFGNDALVHGLVLTSVRTATQHIKRGFHFAF